MQGEHIKCQSRDANIRSPFGSDADDIRLGNAIGRAEPRRTENGEGYNGSGLNAMTPFPYQFRARRAHVPTEEAQSGREPGATRSRASRGGTGRECPEGWAAVWGVADHSEDHESASKRRVVTALA